MTACGDATVHPRPGVQPAAWWRRWRLSLLPWLLLAMAPAGLRGQVHQLEPLPWAAMADTSGRRGAAVSWQHHLDPVTEWRADRLGLTLTYPVGVRSVVFVRGGFWRLDTAARRALTRWPRLLLTGQEADGEPGWPFESTVTGFDRPEVGVLMPLGLPLLGEGGLGFLAGLPIGHDRPAFPLPIGVQAEVNATKGELVIL